MPKALSLQQQIRSTPQSKSFDELLLQGANCAAVLTAGDVFEAKTSLATGSVNEIDDPRLVRSLYRGDGAQKYRGRAIVDDQAFV